MSGDPLSLLLEALGGVGGAGGDFKIISLLRRRRRRWRKKLVIFTSRNIKFGVLDFRVSQIVNK